MYNFAWILAYIHQLMGYPFPAVGGIQSYVYFLTEFSEVMYLHIAFWTLAPGTVKDGLFYS